MKKTLVALAVLAVSGASFAQVTITGQLAMGYQASSKNGADASGLGVDTSEINFMATEDLGGGMKATAKMGLAGADRSGESSGTVAGRDASLNLTGGFGSVTLSAVRSADYLSGGVSGVAGLGIDGKVFGARRTADGISYSVPVGPVTLLLAHGENNQASATNGGTMALGTGATGSSFQRVNTIGVTFASGKLVANGQYLSYDNRATPAANTTADYVTRAAASYDLGVAKLGAGFSQANYTGGGTDKDMLLGVSVPFGAVTVGAQIGQRKRDGFTATTDFSSNGTGLGVTYALSKRTSAIGNYKRWDVLNQAASSEYNLLVSHSF